MRRGGVRPALRIGAWAGAAPVLLIVLVIAVSGCAKFPLPSPTPTPAVPVAVGTVVVSRRPGTVIVLVNGTPMGKLACGATLPLVVGTDGAPALPWRLDVVEADGHPFGVIDLPYAPPMVLVTPAGVQQSLTEGPSFDPPTQCGP